MENIHDLTDEELQQKARLFIKAYQGCDHVIERLYAAFSLFDMEMKIVDRPCQMPRESGVYVFFDDEILYVGQSIILPNRCTGRPERNGGKIAFATLPDKILKIRELQLIAVLHPKYNSETKGLCVSFGYTGAI